MNIIEFVKINGLEEADAIVLRKKFLGMVDHYAIYIGVQNGFPRFIANYTNGGVRIIPLHEINEFMTKLKPTEIQKFVGNAYERTQALNRAISRIGENAYSFFSNNCEHFKNWVHYGENRSEQVNRAGNSVLGISAVVGITAVARKNPKIALVCLVGLLIGLALKDVATEEI